MAKDGEDKMQIIYACKICSKEMKESDILFTVEAEEGSLKSTAEAIYHLCSSECCLAFTLYKKLDLHEKACGYIDVESTICELKDFNEWDEEKINIAIQNLLINGSSSMKEALNEYLSFNPN